MGARVFMGEIGDFVVEANKKLRITEALREVLEFKFTGAGILEVRVNLFRRL